MKPGEPRPIRTEPNDGAKVRYNGRAGRRRPHRQVQGDGWCRIEVGKRDGYIRTSDLWGVGETEVVD